ncbi:MAG: hypothetical protein ABI651_07210, partial [Verrucomicrobiota bacterium]
AEFSRPFGTYATANSKPGSELPGYSQISLREKLRHGFDQLQVVKMSKLQRTAQRRPYLRFLTR